MTLAEQQERGYTCQACGWTSETWFARCPSCQVWSTTKRAPAPARAEARAPNPPRGELVHLAAVPVTRAPRRVAEEKLEEPIEVSAPIVPQSIPVPIVDVDVSARETRIATGIEPLDRVLGGGIVVGSLVLLGGDPGIGKSTLMMQMAASSSCDGCRLYATGEESAPQVAMRAHRVGAAIPDIQVVRETDVDAIIWHAIDRKARLVFVDSIHAISTSRVSGLAGSDYQVKVCGQLLMKFAKDTGIATVVISHVNKDGDISGPKNFEHAGDVTLMFERSELGDPWRTLRALKNRFGSELEIGMFQMAGEGLIPVDKGSEPEPSPSRDEMTPIAQELAYCLLELGGEIDPGLHHRIAGRLDLAPRGRP